MLRYLALLLVAAISALPSLRAQEYIWDNSIGDSLFSTAGNWFYGSVPTSPAPALSFTVSGTANNDLTGLSANALTFAADGAVLTGQQITNVANVNFNDFSSAGTNTVDIALTASNYGFATTTFAGQHLRFTQEVAINDATYFFFHGYTLDNSVTFAGANGALTTTAPAIGQVLGATVSFDNSSAVNTSRWSADAQLNLRTNARVRLIGNDSVSVTQSFASVKSYTSDILEVQNQGASALTTLQIGQMDLTGGAVLLHRSTGGANQVLGSADGPQIKYDGQAASDFLGPQMFYLSGDLESGAAAVEFAAYDPATGVVSATTDINNVETVDNATANVLQTTSNGSFSGTSTMHSLAYNADNLYGGTFNLTHLLLGPAAGTLGVDLNFGAAEGSITADHWGSLAYKDAYLVGNIQGTNSLTFRGASTFRLMSENTFSGTVKFAGTLTTLEFSGQFAQVSAVELGDEGRFTRLTLQAGADRLADDAAILVTADSELAANSEAGLGPASEQIGDITVAMHHTEVFNNRRFLLAVRPTGGVDDPASPLALTAASLAFSETASNNRVDITVQGSNNSITIQGPAIEVKNGNMLYLDLQAAGTRIALEGGVTVALGEQGTVGLSASYDSPDAFQTTLAADLDLQDGTLELLSDHGLLALEGDLTMGEMLETYLYLNAAETSVALIAIDGDLTLDGDLFVSSNLGYLEGTWLLFTVTGTILDEGWTIQGLDGQYNYYTQGNNVYLTTDAVPEPSTCILLAIALAATFTHLKRRKLA